MGRARKQREALWEGGRCGKRPGFEWQESVCVGESQQQAQQGLLCTLYQVPGPWKGRGAWASPGGQGVGLFSVLGLSGQSGVPLLPRYRIDACQQKPSRVPPKSQSAHQSSRIYTPVSKLNVIIAARVGTTRQTTAITETTTTKQQVLQPGFCHWSCSVQTLGQIKRAASDSGQRRAAGALAGWQVRCYSRLSHSNAM